MPGLLGRVVTQDFQPSFRGGLNTVADESQLQPDEVREAQNARLTEYGGITKRLGTQRTHDTTLQTSNPMAEVAGGFTWRKTNPATHLAICEGHLFTAPHGAYPWSWSDISSGFDPAVRPGFASFHDASQDAVYIADGGQLSKWVASALTLNIAGTPTVGRLAVHNLRLFAVGDSSAPEMLYFSGLNNGDTLGIVASGGGSALIRTFGHEALTALLSVGQSLLIFHERGISRFTGWSQDDFNVDSGTRGVTQDVGTIAPNSVTAVENVGFFMSDRGAYAVTESGVQAISPKIEVTLSAVSSTDLALTSAVHHRAFREVWFFIPNLGVMVYNYRLQAWTGPLVGIYLDQSPCLFWESSAGTSAKIFFGGLDGFVRQADVSALGQDDARSDGTLPEPYSLGVRCHRMFFGDPAAEKSLRYVYVTTNLRGSTGASVGWETGEESATVAVSQPGTTTLWGVGGWGAFSWGLSGSVTARVQAHGRGRYVDVRITDDGITTPVFSRIEAQGFLMGRRY